MVFYFGRFFRDLRQSPFIYCRSRTASGTELTDITGHPMVLGYPEGVLYPSHKRILMAKDFTSGDNDAFHHSPGSQGDLASGSRIIRDPRFTGKFWSSARFEKDGFSIAHGRTTLQTEYVWQMRVPERSLVAMILLKGVAALGTTDGSVVWLDDAMFHFSFWRAAESHLIRIRKGPFEMAVLEMNGAFIRRHVDRTPWVRHNERVISLPSVRGPFEITGSLNGNMRHLVFHLLHPEFASPELESPGRGYLKRLVTLILESNFRKEDPRMEDLFAYIRQHIHERVPLKLLCERMSMSESYLKRHFKRVTGSSVYHYIIKLKMALAMDLVTRTDLPIRAIASEVGYDSLESFGKMFTSRFGHPPTYFRTRGDDEIRKG
jgi:AraC-like DNA-binding protein